MKSFSSSYLIDPRNKAALLILIREDLKSQKVFDQLSSLGLEDTFYQSDLTEIILNEVGLSPESEEDQYFYHTLVRQYAQRVTIDQKKLDELTVEILIKLLERFNNHSR